MTDLKKMLARHAPDLICLVLCALAFAHGVRATHALLYPYDIDFFVHLSHARSVLDGYVLVDPYYLHESQWYNPLVSWLIAATAWLFNLPLPVACTRMGAYLNLFAPLCFYALAVRLIGKWAAAASLLGFLFLAKLYLPACYLATYSPWIYANNFMQAFFYIALLVYMISLKDKKKGWIVATGILLGIAFLGHSGTALILGLVIGIIEPLNMILSWKASRGSFRAVSQGVIRIGIIYGLAFLVSLPFLYSILFHYHLKVLNGAPNDWMPSFLRLENLRDFWMANKSKRNFVALIGMIVLAFQPNKTVEKKILFTWGAVCVLFLAFGYLGQAVARSGFHLFRIVPPNHFFFYLNGVLALFFGYGLAKSAGFSADLLRRARSAHLASPLFRFVPGERIILCALMLLFFILYYPSYASRFDYTEAPAKARAIAAWSDGKQSYDWIRRHSRLSEVFLANDMWGMYVVGPAGRKCVAVLDLCSNPFVDWRSRNADRESMVAYLTGNSADRGMFDRLIAKYSVRFVLVSPSEWRISKELPFLKKEFSGDDMEIYRIVQ